MSKPWATVHTVRGKLFCKTCGSEKVRWLVLSARMQGWHCDGLCEINLDDSADDNEDTEPGTRWYHHLVLP